MTITRQQLNGPKTVIIDQALISATNFLTALLLARFLGIHEFGIYTLFVIVLILLDTFHHSIFSAPMMTLSQTKSDPAKQEEYFLSIRTAQAITSLTITFVSYIIGLLVLHNTHHSQLSIHLTPFTLCIFIIPMQEWLRRYLFTKRSRFDAFYLDALKAMIQMGLLIYYATSNLLSVEIALYILAFASTITYLIGSIHHRLRFSFNRIWPIFIENWRHARHLLPSYLLEWVRLQGFLVFGGFLLGAEAAGAIRAAQNMLGPLNIIHQAAENILPIEGARRLATEGEKSMFQYFKAVEIKGVLLLSIPCLFISIYSELILEIFYGFQFSQYYLLVIWQAFSLLLGYSIKVRTSLLRTISETKSILSSTIASSLVLVAIILPFSNLLGENGIMLAKIGAEVISLLFMTYVIAKTIRVN